MRLLCLHMTLHLLLSELFAESGGKLLEIGIKYFSLVHELCLIQPHGAVQGLSVRMGGSRCAMGRNQVCTNLTDSPLRASPNPFILHNVPRKLGAGVKTEGGMCQPSHLRVFEAVQPQIILTGLNTTLHLDDLSRTNRQRNGLLQLAARRH